MRLVRSAAFPSVAALPFLFFAACASTAMAPGEAAQRSAAAIVAAEEGGAAHNAEAELYLRLAKDEFAYSQRLPNPSDRARVDRLLERAQADAELSLALARSEEQKAILRATLADGKASIRKEKDSERRDEHERATDEIVRAAKESERIANEKGQTTKD